MHYKTIILELLEQDPELHEQLRSKRHLLPALERYTDELKASHEVWKSQLLAAMPGSEESQVASEALEMALEDLQRRLLPASQGDGSEALSLEGAMAYLRSHTPKE